MNEPDRSTLVRLAAHEVLLRRLIAEVEMALPGTIGSLAGPYQLGERPGEAMAAFVAEVDDHISLLLSGVRADLESED